jgi:hypothetical protein
MRCFQSSLDQAILGHSQRESVIRLIAKKNKDPHTIGGYRPISLMNCNSKIFSKCLAKILRFVCKEILGPEQLAYLDGRSMEDGQAVINRALELFRKKELKGLTACIDFRAAFDSCKHEFMWQTLERLNVGPNLIACVKTL